MPNSDTSGVLDDHEFCEAPDPEALLGRSVETSFGLGTVEKVPAGVLVRVFLPCEREGCSERLEAHLSAGAPGLCYVTNPETGAFVADLRDSGWVCSAHRRAPE